MDFTIKAQRHEEVNLVIGAIFYHKGTNTRRRALIHWLKAHC
jgi:hypothetical protein